MSSFGIFNGGKNPNAANSEVLDASTGETAPALPRWERKNFVDFAAPKRIVQQTGKQYGRICPSCGERWRQDRKGGPEPKKQDLSEAAHPVLLDVETTKRAAEAIEGKALEPRPLPEMSEEPPKGPKE